MSKGKIAALVVGGVIVLGAIGNLAEDENTTTSNTRTPETSLSPGSSSSSSTSEFSSWAAEMAVWSTDFGNELGDMSSQLQDQSFLTLLITGDSAARAELEEGLEALDECSSSLPSAPDHAKARNVERKILIACTHYESAAANLRNGLDNADTTTINLAGTELSRGNDAMSEATAALQE